MGYFAYLKNSDNKAVASGSVASTGSTAAGYNVDNSITLPVAKVHRFTGTADEYIEIDLGSAQAITLAAIINHNGSSSGTYKVKAGSSANPSTVIATFTYREFDMFALFASASHRYWRFTFEDATNSNGFGQIGYLILGAYTQPAFNFQYGYRHVPEFNNRRLETDYFVPNVEEIARRVRLELNFGPMTAAESDTIRETLFESLKRDVTPFFLVPDGDINDGYFGRFEQISMIVDFQRYIAVPFVEDGRGNRLELG